MKLNSTPEKIADLLKKRQVKKPPAYQWQDLALRIIRELSIPAFKKGAVFRVCKENNKYFIESCLNETKELCRTGQKWKYFFKLIGGKQAANHDNKNGTE